MQFTTPFNWSSYVESTMLALERINLSTSSVESQSKSAEASKVQELTEEMIDGRQL